MIKRYKILLFLFICILFKYIILDNQFNIRNEEEKMHNKIELNRDILDGISVVIKEGSLSPSGLTLVFRNNNEQEYIFNNEFYLQKYDNDKWMAVNSIIDNYAFSDIGNIIPKNESIEFDINWKWLYGELSDGKYRIIKKISYLESNITNQFGYIKIDFVI